METPTGSTNLLEGAATRSAPAPLRVAVRESADSVISPAGQVGSIARAGRTPRRTRRGATRGASVDQRVILVMDLGPSSCEAQPPAAQTPVERHVVVAQAVAGRQLVRTRWSLDTHATGGTTRQRATGSVWQQTTGSRRPQGGSARAGWLWRWARVGSPPPGAPPAGTRRRDGT